MHAVAPSATVARNPKEDDIVAEKTETKTVEIDRLIFLVGGEDIYNKKNEAS